MNKILERQGARAPAVEIDASQSRMRLSEPSISIRFDFDGQPGSLQDLPISFELSLAESRSFLRIIARSLYAHRHYELFQMAQAEVQDFIPHRILLSAWGDFEGGELQVDVISAVPGVRTNRPSSCDIERLLHDLYVRWLANGRHPLLLNKIQSEQLAESECRCALHESLRGMGAVLVHGNRNERDETESLYVALNHGPIQKTGVSAERFRFLSDLIVAQLDAAFRKVTAFKNRGKPEARTARMPSRLSQRELEIIDWVAKGRTNVEISGVLMISEFTVKNHMRRIMKKLGASNRTEAAAMFRGESMRWPPTPGARTGLARAEINA